MQSRTDQLKILVVGSLPPPLGGCSVTLQHLVDELRRRPDVALRVVDTSGIRGNGWRGAARLARSLGEVARLSRSVDVVTLHVATTALPEWGLAVQAAARAAGRPFVLRKFADTDYRRLGRVRGRLAELVVSRADAYLVETKRHLEAVRARGFHHARWFPTARPLAVTPARAGDDRSCRRFVFVGHLARNKGIELLVEAVRAQPDAITVDLYGPRFDDVPASVLGVDPRVRWHGPLQPSEVPGTLARYDAFVLPTIATTEGYPGSLLEAYAAGLPVIASRIGGIPEIVDASCGVLVEPGDVVALRDAMRALASDVARFQRLRAAAATRARDFSTERWCDEFVACCREVIAARVAPRRPAVSP